MAKREEHKKINEVVHVGNVFINSDDKGRAAEKIVWRLPIFHLVGAPTNERGEKRRALRYMEHVMLMALLRQKLLLIGSPIPFNLLSIRAY